MTLRKYSAVKVSTTSKFSASANNFRAVTRKKVSVNIVHAGEPPTVPGAPTIGTATATGSTTATVSFTAPASNGGVTITTYTATSSPGNITGTLSQAGSGTINVTGLTSGTSYTFTVTATNSVGTSSPSASSNSITTFVIPVNTVAPIVSGTAVVGSTLSTTNGTWTGTPTITFTYQWQRNGVNIGSATASTYTLVEADSGNPIRCVVTGTNSYGNASANSNATSNVVSVINLYDTAIFSGLASTLSTNLNNLKNASFYEYTLDGSASFISDGSGDMYDQGNYTHLFINGSQVASGISYNTGVSSTSNGGLAVKWAALGYARPLSVIATSQNNVSTRYGFGRSGGNGADGSGTADAITIYSNATVSGFTVNAWMKRVYNAGDPSINDLYVTIGHTRFGSSFSSTNVQSFSGNTDDGQSQYEITSTNSIVYTSLLSKNSGVAVSQAEAQTVITNLLALITSHFSL